MKLLIDILHTSRVSSFFNCLYFFRSETVALDLLIYSCLIYTARKITTRVPNINKKCLIITKIHHRFIIRSVNHYI